MIKVKSETNKENETIIIPYYDIGIKSKLSDKWVHFFRIEATYVIAYTEQLNIDDMLGLRVVPSFSFGYQF